MNMIKFDRDYLAALIKEHPFSQKAQAEDLGISRNTLRLILRGESPVKVSFLNILGRYYKTEPVNFIQICSSDTLGSAELEDLFREG